MRMLRVPRNERVSFRRQLKALVAAGELLQVRGNRYGLPEKMDLVVGQFNEGRMRVFKGQGDGQFAAGSWIQAEGKTAEVPGVW